MHELTLLPKRVIFAQEVEKIYLKKHKKINYRPKVMVKGNSWCKNNDKETNQ